MGAAEHNSTRIGSFLAGLGSRASDSPAATAEATAEQLASLSEALLNSPDVQRVIKLNAVQLAPDELFVAAKIDVAPELTMRQVSVIVNLAERRIRAALPEAKTVYVSPDVWIDPEAAQPTTSAIVLRSGN